MFKIVLSRLVRSIVQPTKRAVPVRPMRALVGLPGFFDVASWFLQVADLRNAPNEATADQFEDAGHLAAHNYNAKVTREKLISTTRRAELLYRLAALPHCNKTAEALLIVGPRNRQELLLAWVHGFSWHKIHAIDLYATNKKITVGNMEDMTWPDASFDVVTMANTLAYAVSTQKVMGEVARVLKAGGRFVFSATHIPAGSSWQENSVPYEQIETLLGEAGLRVAASFPSSKVNALGLQQTVHTVLAFKSKSVLRLGDK